ncbi:MAG TPA: hypothetical protein VMI54_11735 [Polyangiaceae bacterium]|nr:hypothetical protein [Polyangiaceae bacterium]
MLRLARWILILGFGGSIAAGCAGDDDTGSGTTGGSAGHGGTAGKSSTAGKGGTAGKSGAGGSGATGGSGASGGTHGGGSGAGGGSSGEGASGGGSGAPGGAAGAGQAGMSTGTAGAAGEAGAGGAVSDIACDPRAELVQNGDFDAGFDAFETDYTTVDAPTQISTNGACTVASDPSVVRETYTDWVKFGDHTTGDGPMLICDGALTAGAVTWKQTVNVVPHTSYLFTFWLSNIEPSSSLSTLQGFVNDEQIGSTLTADPTAGTWAGYVGVWDSGTNTSATLSIVDSNTGAAWNDFALDDVSFVPLCTSKLSDACLSNSTWTQTQTSSNACACQSSTWKFVPLGDGTWSATESGCANATGVVHARGETVSVDFSYADGDSATAVGVYTFPLEACMGGDGTVAWSAGSCAGVSADSSWTRSW